MADHVFSVVKSGVDSSLFSNRRRGRQGIQSTCSFGLAVLCSRDSNTVGRALVDIHRKSPLAHDQEKDEAPRDKSAAEAPRDYKYVFPDFLPDPTWFKRDRLREKLERSDMLNRRTVMDIPEFYVGSIMSVSVSDQYAPGKKNRFVGICISRGGYGLRAHFTLRNIVDGQGVEIMYEMYNPTLLEIDVLKLEKRVDDELYYLRDAPQEYSTVPFDFENVPHPPGAAVPVNHMKVKLNPRPWHERWERKELRGVEDLNLPDRFYEKAAKVAQPWEKYDIMKQYRKNINPVETKEIMDEVHQSMETIKEKTKYRRLVMTSKKR